MEIFKDIIKFEDKYQISNLGNVRSKKTGLFLKPKYNKKGYQYVHLSYSHTGFTKWYIHRLVAFHFIPNPENKPQVNHIDGIVDNNSVDNLEWCTNDENQKHAVLHNLHYQGEASKSHKFTEKTIKILPDLFLVGLTIKQIAEITGVANSTIADILYGRKWRPLNLQFPYVRKGKQRKSLTLYMSEDLYCECVKHWGNTVLNTMIAKGQLSLTKA